MHPLVIRRHILACGNSRIGHSY
uniref:Uncharacterized protein n=1 Tax=Rhizophora mucronata TaxID=61149 RepID=A0A2P2Q5C4_RHIMU